MKAYRCNNCKNYFGDRSYAKIKLHVNVTRENPSSFTIFDYDICEDCYALMRKNFGVPYAEIPSNEFKII